MSIKPSVIIEYLNWALKKYKEIQQKTYTPDVFRISNIAYNKAGKCIFKIQVIGKATVFDCMPQDIVANDKLLEGFSKKDIRTITYFATQEIKKPKYKILIQEFHEGINKMIFKIGVPSLDKPIEKTADQISLDKDLVNKLNAEDAHLIGFTTATEQAIREKGELEKLRNR